MWRIVCAGVGSAFTDQRYYQSNFVIENSHGSKLLLDCGSHAQFSLAELNLYPKDIDAVYISHLHADHIGGLEWLAFMRKFSQNKQKPVLYAADNLLQDLWDKSLRGGLESIQGDVMSLTGYFECHAVPINNFFQFGNLKMTPVQTVHIMSGMGIVNSYGLLIQEITVHSDEDKNHPQRPPVVFITTDTQHCPSQIQCFYNQADLILHDCETSQYKSGVHAHYTELMTLDAKTKQRMMLYHYQPEPKQDPWVAGFAGFLKKGMVLPIDTEPGTFPKVLRLADDAERYKAVQAALVM